MAIATTMSTGAIGHIWYPASGRLRPSPFCRRQASSAAAAVLFPSVQAVRDAGFEVCPDCLDPNANRLLAKLEPRRA
jgi:hypothetical protein